MAGDWRRPASWLIGLSLVTRSESVKDDSNSWSKTCKICAIDAISITPLNALRFPFAALPQARCVLLHTAASRPMNEQMLTMPTSFATAAALSA
ncbi:hypothetical protein [Bradyrhizobium sp. CB2312]|uniref:hypothetical protein n=1 Tax=Bradyrhizobium sp. CB2312 TaxID=3039155 RepID=UPI0024B1787A|nr:hypothetical protein [Bradyrhizobium sp. CB2312]WFU76472.1 hypothetical protein QA642_21935 [Bradyrhizobium sp. CB2312]